MSAHKTSATRCHLEHQAWSRQPAIWALPQSPSRGLVISVHLTWSTTSCQTTCTVSERSSIKGTCQCKPTWSSFITLWQLPTLFNYEKSRMHRQKAVADLRGVQGKRTPWGSKFFKFHAVFGKIWQNCMLAPHLAEILDPPLKGTQYKSMVKPVLNAKGYTSPPIHRNASFHGCGKKFIISVMITKFKFLLESWLIYREFVSIHSVIKYLFPSLLFIGWFRDYHRPNFLTFMQFSGEKVK